jgi:cell fate (sporulation/competence/biofilm development) regulator YmcA (YheA/YmcA/DUF963 family)
MTEQLQHKQRAEREHHAKQKYLEQLNSICVHRKEIVTANHAHQDRALKLGCTVQMCHANMEKEEAK